MRADADLRGTQLQSPDGPRLLLPGAIGVRSYDTSKMHAMMKLRPIQMSAPRAL